MCVWDLQEPSNTDGLEGCGAQRCQNAQDSLGPHRTHITQSRGPKTTWEGAPATAHLTGKLWSGFILSNKLYSYGQKTLVRIFLHFYM